MKKTNPFSPFTKEVAFELPFFIFLSLILVGISIWSVVTIPALRTPARLIPFVILMIVHITMYWLAAYVAKNIHLILGFLLVQGLLAFVINWIGQNLGLISCLYLGLIGITVGLLKMSRRAIGVIGFYLVLSLVNFEIFMGWDRVILWVAGTIPAMIFVIMYVLLYNRQGEARARTQALLSELEIANQHLAEYAARVEELTLVNERQRMARELHDTLSQGLAGLILQLEAVDAHLTNNRSDRARVIVQQTMLQARTTLSDARRAIADLRQVQTVKADITEAIRELAKTTPEIAHFIESVGIANECQLEIDLQQNRFSDTIPAALYDVIKSTVAEALINISRHAHASLVQVRLVGNENNIVLNIHDNGVGFDPEAAGWAQSGHYGILGMRERARLAGGTLEVKSKPGEGTTVILRLPQVPGVLDERRT